MIHWLIIAVLAGVALWGCQTDKPPVLDQPFKIGVIFPFSGKNCAIGADLQSGVELALDIVNQEFDLPIPLAPGKGLTQHGGVRLQAIYRDSNFDPIMAARSVEELVIHEKVKVLMGGYTSAESLAISEQTEIFRIPLLNFTSTAPRLTQRGLQWFFRLSPDDTLYVNNFFQLLQNIQENHPGSVPRRLVLIFENGPWGTGVAQVARKLAKKYGYEIIAELPYDGKTNSIEKILSNKSYLFQSPTILLQASYRWDTVAWLQAYKSLGIQPTAILAMSTGLFSPEFISRLGPHLEHLMSPGVWSMDVSTKKPLAVQVNNLYRQRYGRDFSSNSARSFTGTLVLADALNRASALTPKAIREALLKTDIPAEHLILPWHGIKFEPHSGQNIQGDGFIVQIQQGESRTVWPKDLATSQVIWPSSLHKAPQAQQ
jgi:branched-chain amino acid transport system substrate-binding protein